MGQKATLGDSNPTSNQSPPLSNLSATYIPMFYKSTGERQHKFKNKQNMWTVILKKKIYKGPRSILKGLQHH